MNRPDFLVIGHISKDLLDKGFALGGTVTYSALTARNLGREAGVITSASSDIDLGKALDDDIEVLCLPSLTTTTFRNIYPDGVRQQYVYATARRIGPEDVPERWRHSPIVHLGPIAQEVDEEIIHSFYEALIGVTPQGWIRGWDEAGRVFYKDWKGARTVLPKISVVIFSNEDVVDDQALAQAYAQLAEIVVVTQGRYGATVYYRGKPHHFPARSTFEVDPTGAGDVFAAAYLVRLYETDDPYEAARFANIIASFSVEKPGTSGIPVGSGLLSALRANS